MKNWFHGCLVLALWFGVNGMDAAASMPSHLTGAESPVELVLPEVIYAVAGHEMNLYFENIVRVRNPQNYSWAVESPKGRLDELRWRFVPDSKDVGSFPLVVKVYDSGDQLIAEAATRVVVSNAAGGNEKAITMLLIGDSLTDAAIYPRQLLELLRRDGAGQFRLVGSHAGRGEAPQADFAVEGYGGWRWRTFCERWTDDGDYRARSKFLADGKELDFAAYFDRYCDGRAPDVIAFFLGINDIAGAAADGMEAAIRESMFYAEKLISAARAAAPNALIGIALIPPPSASQDAFGRNYGTRIQYHRYRKNQHALLTAMLERYSGDSRISLIPVYINLDCRNGYPVETEKAFAGSDLDVMRGSNAVHPGETGYRQIAESFYAWLRAHIQ